MKMMPAIKIVLDFCMHVRHPVVRPLHACIVYCPGKEKGKRNPFIFKAWEWTLGEAGEKGKEHWGGKLGFEQGSQELGYY